MHTSDGGIYMHLDCCHVQACVFSTVAPRCWNMHIDYMYIYGLDAWLHVDASLWPNCSTYYMIQQNT